MKKLIEVPEPKVGMVYLDSDGDYCKIKDIICENIHNSYFIIEFAKKPLEEVENQEELHEARIFISTFNNSFVKIIDFKVTNWQEHMKRCKK